MGLLSISTIGLGIDSVRLPNLDPRPHASITDFINLCLIEINPD